MRLRLFVIALIAVGTCYGQTDLSDVLNQRLKGKRLAFRTPVVSKYVRFDVTGKLIGDMGQGLRSTDGELLVKSVRVRKESIGVKGERVCSGWDEKAGVTRSKCGEVEVEIGLPPRASSEEEIAKTFYRVFLTPAEASSRSCTAEEDVRFREVVESRQKMTPKGSGEKRGSKQTEATPASKVVSSKPPEMVCLPTGERGYVLRDPISPPKILKSVDSSLGQDSSRGVGPTSEFLILVNEKGEVGDALLISGKQPQTNLNQLMSFRDYRFTPSMYEGKAVPVCIFFGMQYSVY